MTTIENNPLVSIIIPCWNAEDYVGEAIESALAQTYANVEVIVIDDGSTDGSLEVIRSFGDRVRWETGPNRGACAARNRGLELSRGELIQFLDSDDLLFPEKLTRMVPVAIETECRVAPICNWETVQVNLPDAVIQGRLDKTEGEDSVLFCLRSQLPTPSPLHWRENLFAVKGFDELLRCSQERDLHLRLACSGIEFVHMPEVHVRVRRQPNSISSDYLRILRAHGGIFEGAFARLANEGALTESRRRAFAKAVAHDGRSCLRQGEPELARRYFSLARSMSQDGSLEAFGRVSTRTIAKLLGPMCAERVCQIGVALGVRS